MNAAANPLPLTQRLEAFLQAVKARPDRLGRFPCNLPRAFEHFDTKFFSRHFKMSRIEASVLNEAGATIEFSRVKRFAPHDLDLFECLWVPRAVN